MHGSKVDNSSITIIMGAIFFFVFKLENANYTAYSTRVDTISIWSRIIWKLEYDCIQFIYNNTFFYCNKSFKWMQVQYSQQALCP